MDEIEGFLDRIECAMFNGSDRQRRVIRVGHQDDRSVRIGFANTDEKRNTILTRHFYIANDGFIRFFFNHAVGVSRTTGHAHGITNFL